MRLLVLVGCCATMALVSLAAKASGGGTIEGGTITFVGAVVEPTCSVAAMPADVNQVVGAAQAHQSMQRSCSDTSAVAAMASASRPYLVDVVSLSGSQSDRVLQYFANYVRAAQPESANPVLVTQTYE
ncbi:hypothetical protein [Dyella choica]|uniref:Type 1 fimbrial protein n=1 Tax=Dyella choica TaxID=1927959 RepID=A0A3S0WVH6_9GAMM|nr:hypothetical protein [Dyella choica]RUL74884.1 hypothetical protein EKH80_12435 [Dyella choica]